MGASGGPDLVTDGLVLCLDKYDEDSYMGQPTTNLAPTGMNSWSVNASGYSSYGTRTLRTEVYSNEIANIVDTDDNTRQYSWISGLSENTVYSFSNYYRKISGTPTFRYQLSWYTAATALISANWVQTANLGIADVSGWQRAMCTITTPANTDKMIWWLQDGADYTGYTHEFEIKRPMMETNSHVTKFVNGSRSATDGWKDLSGNGNHADLTSLTYSTTNIRNTPNNDFSFVQSSNNMVKRSALTQTTSMTCCAWIYPTNGNGGIINTISSSNKDGFYFGFYDSYNPTVYAADSNGGDWSVARASSAVSANTWSYVCAVLDGVANTCTIFINGTQIASSATSGGSGGWMWGNNDLQIGGNFGNWNSNTEFDGRIEIVQIYGEALSAAQIAQNFNAQRSRFGV